MERWVRSAKWIKFCNCKNEVIGSVLVALLYKWIDAKWRETYNVIHVALASINGRSKEMDGETTVAK